MSLIMLGPTELTRMRKHIRKQLRNSRRVTRTARKLSFGRYGEVNEIYYVELLALLSPEMKKRYGYGRLGRDV